MHMTYASPGSAEAYPRTGKFPNGTVLVKEVFGTDHAQITTSDAQLGLGDDSLVRNDPGRKRSAHRQSALGRRLGMGAVQVRCTR